MTRQLVDVLRDVASNLISKEADNLVASLLTEPAEHTIECPTCNGGLSSKWRTCPDNCTNGRQTVLIGIIQDLP